MLHVRLLLADLVLHESSTAYLPGAPVHSTVIHFSAKSVPSMICRFEHDSRLREHTYKWLARHWLTADLPQGKDSVGIQIYETSPVNGPPPSVNQATEAIEQ